eukprot:COSAG06_NODE_10667_length_1639_cov_146.282468_1_plen_119_part_00
MDLFLPNNGKRIVASPSLDACARAVRVNVVRVVSSVHILTFLANSALEAHQMEVSVAVVSHSAVDSRAVVVHNKIAGLPEMLVDVPTAGSSSTVHASQQRLWVRGGSGTGVEQLRRKA